MNIRRLMKLTKKAVKKNAATGFTVVGILGVAVTAYFVAKETKNAEELKEDATPAEKTAHVLTTYPKSIAAGAITATSIYLAHRANRTEIAALTAAGVSQASKHFRYDEKVEELIGKDANDKIKSDIVREKLHQPEVLETAIYTGHGNILCYEPLCGHFFYASQAYIIQTALALDKSAKKYKEDYITLNEWFEELNLPMCIFGENYGFAYDPDGDSIDIRFGTAVIEGIPYLEIRYLDNPVEIGI